MTAGRPELLRTGPASAAHTIVLAHGAGAGMRSPFMTSFADGLGSRGIAVCRFEFPYMQEMSASGRRLPPNREPAGSTVQNEWGFFDPGVCGFSALSKLDESVTEAAKPEPLEPTLVRVIPY